VLSHLKAWRFRNLGSCRDGPFDWCPGAGRHLLLGDNGAGKTSVLEAIYVLATTRSFRASRLAVCARHEAESLRLEGEVTDDRRWRLDVGWSRKEGLSRAVDGAASSLAAHLAVLPVVAWTAAEGKVVTGEPALRRRFLDRGVVGLRPTALEVLSRYRQTLDQKRELLSADSDVGPLAPWNDLLAVAAAEVIAARRQYIEKLSWSFSEVIDEAGMGFQGIELRYRPSPRRGVEGAERIRQVLERTAGREREVGFALVGPQRDDVEISWNGHPVREVASAGERKALSLCLSAAHGRVLEKAGRQPLYLLDDLDTELSPETLSKVWKVFAEVRQMIGTSNRSAVWKDKEPDQIWRLQSGCISQL